MSPFVCYHATSRWRRESIQVHGLIPHTPSRTQPLGVYAFSPDLENDAALACRWEAGPLHDLWCISYIGPMQRDPLVRNSVILPHVTSVTRVTGNE
jgi:hypothetical protein